MLAYRSFIAACLTLSLSGCASFVTERVADQLAGHGLGAEDNLQLAREASAFYLKLSESVLAQTPGHGPLATAVSGGFTQYSYAFVAFEAEKLESQQPRAAKAGRERAARLYLRAHGHAMTALERQSPGLRAALDQGRPLPLRRDQVGLAYWAAASWAGAISLSKDQPERVAELPLALRLAREADALDPAHSDGALASLLGTLDASRPGGSAEQARRHFERARAAAQGRNAGLPLAEAEALVANDRPAFEILLRESLAIALQHRNLANEVMRERAQWLLDTLDDRF